MTKIPTEVLESMKKADVFILASSNREGVSNVVYIGYIRALDDETVLIADNQMVKTLANLLDNPQAAFTFRDELVGSYQIKGSVEYHTDDEYHEQVKSWCKPHLARKGAVVMHVEEVYNGAKRLAGNKK
jgi:uncharacterized protein